MSSAVMISKAFALAVHNTTEAKSKTSLRNKDLAIKCLLSIALTIKVDVRIKISLVKKRRLGGMLVIRPLPGKGAATETS
jgi:hypothetical protein